MRIEKCCEREESERSVQIRALDFDWVFNGKNTIKLLEALQDSADEELWDKRSIKALIALIW